MRWTVTPRLSGSWRTRACAGARWPRCVCRISTCCADVSTCRGRSPSIGPVDELLDERRELDRKLTRRLREQVAGSRLRAAVCGLVLGQQRSSASRTSALRYGLPCSLFLFDEFEVVGLRKGHQVSVDLF